MSTPTTPPTKTPAVPAEFDPVKFTKKTLIFVAIIAIAIAVLATIKESKEERRRNPSVEQQVESSVTGAPSVVHVPAGAWFDVYPDPHGKMTILPIESGITCTFRVNDDPKEWTTRNGNPVNLSAENPGVTIWKVRVKPDKDATFLTTR
jgi:hypothetical protein